MKRMGKLLTRKGILRKLTVFVCEYASQLKTPEAAQAGWIGLMGVNSFVEALLGVQPKGLLRESMEFFLANLPDEVEEEVDQYLRTLVEGIMMNIPEEDLKSIIAQAQRKRKKHVRFLGSPILDDMKSKVIPKKMTPDEIVNSDLSAVEKERMLIELKETQDETQEARDQEDEEGTQEEVQG